MTDLDLQEYFLNLSISCVDIGTSSQFIKDPDIFDVKTMKQNRIYLFCPPTTTRFTSTNDAFVQREFAELWFLVSCSKDSAAQQNARFVCKEVAKQFVAKILEHRSSQMHYIVKDLDPASIVIEPAGPLLEAANAHGVSMKIFIGDRAKLTVNPLKWI